MEEREINEWHAPIMPPPKERKDAPERQSDFARESTPRVSMDKNASMQSRTHTGKPERILNKETRVAETAQISMPPKRSHFDVTKRRFASGQTEVVSSGVLHEGGRGHSFDASLPASSPTSVPLSHLQHGAKKGRQEGAHLSELRQALSDALHSSQVNAREGKTAKVPRFQEDKTRGTTQEKQEHADPPASLSQTREIPEKLLRKLLLVPNPSIKEEGSDKNPPLQSV